jgi:hypothetical protein
VCALLAVAPFAVVESASAQTDDPQALRQEIEQLRRELAEVQRQYGERLSALEARLGTAAVPGVGAPVAQAVAPPPAVGVSPSATSKVFNPDMAVIGNFLGAAGRNTVDPRPALELPESEASFQAIVDPYARADFFMSFGEEGVGVEEGFLTFPAIKGGLLVKVGKMRAAFGKVNTLHSHAVPWTDRPLVINNLVGGEEGISDAGMSVARLISNPWLFLEATGQVYRGDSADVFRSSSRGDLSYVGRLRGYRDFSDDTNLDVGLSYARGHNASGIVNEVDTGRFVSHLWGVDATLRWRPLRQTNYHTFLGRSELVWSRRDQPGGRQPAFGYYVSGDYQVARRWFAGARYDRSERAAEGGVRDSGQSLLLTYWPSEFSQIRSQYRRIRYGEGPTANELLFQFQFSIGAHGAHPF